MAKSVFEFTDYKRYVDDYFKNSPGQGYGKTTRLAEVLNCNTAYISQVFNKGANFSLEQGEELNRHFQHDREESRFFLLLIQHARAGSHNLKIRIKEQIDETAEKRLNLKERSGIKTTISEADQTRFYSHWYYAAVHLIVTVPDFQTPDAISEELNLPIGKIKSILEFLMQIGLVQENRGRYSTGTERLFLGKDSPMIAKHHINWRLRAIESLEREGDPDNRDLHYSSLFTYSKKDSHKVRERLAQAIDEVREIIRESPAEDEMICVNLDYFTLTGRF